MNERLNRREIFKQILPVVAGGIAGLVSPILKEQPLEDPRVPQIQTNQRELADRLLLTNEKINQLAGIVIDHNRIIKGWKK